MTSNTVYSQQLDAKVKRGSPNTVVNASMIDASRSRALAATTAAHAPAEQAADAAPEPACNSSASGMIQRTTPVLQAVSPVQQQQQQQQKSGREAVTACATKSPGKTLVCAISKSTPVMKHADVIVIDSDSDGEDNVDITKRSSQQFQPDHHLHQQHQPVRVKQEPMMSYHSAGKQLQLSVQGVTTDGGIKQKCEDAVTADTTAPAAAAGASLCAADVRAPNLTAAGCSRRAVRQEVLAVAAKADAQEAIAAADIPSKAITTALGAEPACSPATAVLTTIPPIAATIPQQLPLGFSLADCDDDILAAGRQLTKLLDFLHAPDDHMVRLNQCINKFRRPAADKAGLAGFWYDYSQLQSWLTRGNAEECRSALRQLLSNADKAQ